MTFTCKQLIINLPNLKAKSKHSNRAGDVLSATWSFALALFCIQVIWLFINESVLPAVWTVKPKTRRNSGNIRSQHLKSYKSALHNSEMRKWVTRIMKTYIIVMHVFQHSNFTICSLCMKRCLQWSSKLLYGDLHFAFFVKCRTAHRWNSTKHTSSHMCWFFTIMQPVVSQFVYITHQYTAKLTSSVTLL